MSLAISVYVLLIWVMQSVNGPHFLNTTSLLIFGLAAVGGTSVTVIVLLTSIYASL